MLLNRSQYALRTAAGLIDKLAHQQRVRPVARLEDMVKPILGAMSSDRKSAEGGQPAFPTKDQVRLVYLCVFSGTP